MASEPSVASTPTVGRIVGALVLLHIVGALMLPYILLNQVVVSPDFLESAARNPGHLRAPALLFLYAALWRAGLIPRVLAVAGLVTCALQITGVPLRALLGYPVVMEMAVPLGPAYAGLGLWLIVKGFGERRGALDRTKLTF